MCSIFSVAGHSQRCIQRSDRALTARIGGKASNQLLSLLLDQMNLLLKEYYNETIYYYFGN